MFDINDSKACLNKLTLKFANLSCGCLKECKSYVLADALYHSIVLLVEQNKNEEANELHNRLIKLCDECTNC